MKNEIALKFINQAIDSFTEIDNIINNRIGVVDKDKRINELQDLAVEAIGFINPILDRYCKREIPFGQKDKVDMFRLSLTINSMSNSAILKFAITELKMIRPNIQYDTEITTDYHENKSSNNKVFIVHGQNNEIKNTVSLFLTRMGLEPIILHEQDDNGNTIIEKFIHNSNVAFAISLLTPDDEFVFHDKNISRARQNVIFEFGYFLGKLGRENVVALFEQKENFEIPSDIQGLIYIPYKTSEDTWKVRLARSLQKVYNIDLNKLK